MAAPFDREPVPGKGAGETSWRCGLSAPAGAGSVRRIAVDVPVPARERDNARDLRVLADSLGTEETLVLELP